jgi:hypothetical protein
MSPDIVSGIRSNWRSLFGLALLMAVGPMCGSGGGGSSGVGGGSPPPVFKVLSTFPNQSDAGVARTQVIYLTVNGNVDVATMTNANITLTGGTNIPITLSWDPVLGQIKLTPQGPNFMDSNFAHTVNVFAGLKTTGGVAVTPKTFSFTTVNTTDVTPPTFATGVSGATLPASDPHSVTLNWTTPGSDGVTPVGSLIYDVYYGTVSGQINFARPPDISSAPGAANVVVAPLTSNTTFFFVVRCRDAAGNRDQNVVEVSKKTLVSFNDDIFLSIIKSVGRCATCHTPGGMASFMDISISAHDTVVNKWVNVTAQPGTGPSPLPSCGSSGFFRVVANDTAGSLVYQKIQGGSPPPCGVRMPEDGATNGYLTNTQIQVFADWINQGANDN